MIAHVSIPARDPRSIALLLARLIDGESFDFPVVPGARIAVANDGSGLAIEVYPDGMAHHPGTGQPDPALAPAGVAAMPWEDQIKPERSQIGPSAFHLALVSKLGDDEVLRLAEQAGFRAVKCDRAGVFRLVELWIDNSLLVEVLNPAEAERYRQFMNPGGARAMFGHGERPQ